MVMMENVKARLCQTYSQVAKRLSPHQEEKNSVIYLVSQGRATVAFTAFSYKIRQEKMRPLTIWRKLEEHRV